MVPLYANSPPLGVAGRPEIPAGFGPHSFLGGAVVKFATPHALRTHLRIHAHRRPARGHPPVGGRPERGCASTRRLLGVTGSGKTFTIANVIAQVDRPTLDPEPQQDAWPRSSTGSSSTSSRTTGGVLRELLRLLPAGGLPAQLTNTYIEKDLSINDEIEKLRLSTTSALLSGRRNVIVVASVSCIYGIGNPAEFHKTIVHVQKGQKISRTSAAASLVEALYSRKDVEPGRGQLPCPWRCGGGLPGLCRRRDAHPLLG